MAYLPQSQLEKDKDEEVQGGAAAPVLSGPSGTVSSAAGQPSAGASAKGEGTRSGSFTNLNQYLDANAGQGGQLAQKLTDNVASQVDSGKSQLQSAQNTFNTQVQNSGVSRNQNLVNEAVSNPLAAVQDQNKFQQLTKIRDANYNGPNSVAELDDFQSAKQKLDKASGTVSSLQSEAGRMTALKDNFSRPTYSQGQQNLDNLLIQNDPQSRNKFADLKTNFSNINSFLDESLTASQAAAQARKSETAAAKNDFYSAFGRLDDPTTADVNEGSGAYGQLETGINQRLAESTAAREQQLAANAALKQSLAQRQIDAANAAKFGLSHDMPTYNLNLSEYLNLTDSLPATRQNVATKDEYARYSALNKLLNQDDTFLNEAAAGTYQAPSAAMNPQFQADLAAAKSKYEQEYNTDTLGLNWADGKSRTVAQIVNEMFPTFAPEGQPGDGAYIRGLVRNWINQRGGNNKISVK